MTSARTRSMRSVPVSSFMTDIGTSTLLAAAEYVVWLPAHPELVKLTTVRRRRPASGTGAAGGGMGRLPSISGFVRAFGFGGAAAAAVTNAGALSALVGLVVGTAVAIPAAGSR